jgi:hypothetical protein
MPEKKRRLLEMEKSIPDRHCREADICPGITLQKPMPGIEKSGG